MQKIKNFFKLIWAHKGKIILIICVAAGGWYLYKHKTKKQAVAQEAEMTEQVRRGDIMISISKDGAFQAKESFEVNSRANGKIVKKFVKEGDTVKEGQKLFVVQPGQSVHEKYLPIDVIAPASGLVFRCLNDRWSSRSNTNYDLPQIGESVTGSSGYNSPTCLMKIIKPGAYLVPIKIGEYDIPNVKLGMPLKISVPSRPGVSYEGFVARISPQPEVKEENYWDEEKNQVEFITIAETKDNIKEILIGLSATVKIDLDSRANVLLVPTSAIFEERERNGDITFYVYKKDGNKKAEKLLVKLGLRNESDAELLNAEETGLKENDVLLLEEPKDESLNKNSLPKSSGLKARSVRRAR